MNRLFFISCLLLASVLHAQQNNCHIHTVQPGEGIYSISRSYNLKPSQLLSVNQEIGKEMMIKTGQKLCIPIHLATISNEQIADAAKIKKNEKANPVIENSTSKNPTKQGDLWIHTVQKGETFYSICKLYNVLAYDMISTNNLPNTIIAESQKLIVPANANLEFVKVPSEQIVKVPPIEEMPKTAEVIVPEQKVVVKDVAEKKQPKKETKKTEEKKIVEPAKEVLAEVSQPKPTEPEALDETKVETYTVQRGDTYYSLSRKFGLEINDLKNLNNLPSTDIKVGQVLTVSKSMAVEKEDEEKIPENATVIDIAKEVAKREAANKEEAKDVVVIKESIKAKKKADSASKEDKGEERDIAVIKVPEKAKEKPASTLKEEEIITVKSATKKAAEAPAKAKKKSRQESDIELVQKETEAIDIAPTDAVAVVKDQAPKKVPSAYEEYSNTYASYVGNNEYRQLKARGIAEYVNTENGNEYLIFYDGAEPGSIVKITNLMNKNSAYGKVAGNVTKNDEANNESMLTVSKKLAEQLQVLDDKFLVEITKYSKN